MIIFAIRQAFNFLLPNRTLGFWDYILIALIVVEGIAMLDVDDDPGATGR